MRFRSDKVKYALGELAHHLPFSVFGVVSAIIMMSVLTFIAKIVQAEDLMPGASAEMFHVFHPAHILFSAVATTAMFWKHDNRNLLKAATVGFVGSIGICGISDIFIPYWGGALINEHMHMHICLIEHPQIIIPFALVGIFSGLMVTKSFERSTQYSHAVHIFLSSTASLLYLISYGLTDWMHAISGVFFITVVAVMVPCCLSDIIFPLLCTHKYCEHQKS